MENKTSNNQNPASSPLLHVLREDQNNTQTWKNVSKAAEAAKQAREKAVEKQK